ncbi:protein of unknown function [Paenibacillus sp. UNCCL117]|uniref:DUF4179 domain-containing protein n=1 Tax=unclassified Paenibacillus TaxID=185978 RepID=UPI00088DDE4F|nr:MULTISPECIES: DUF4179 domain-containing protein [unclassified Paenibacillus]SDC93881.1 protein of unknown function [Paenibacillus sp. cl123]SFW29664.1 protein of unknown function [Paenibacillus sp. UNCCL117]
MDEAFHTDELELKDMFNETKLPPIHLEAKFQIIEHTHKTAKLRKMVPHKWVLAGISFLVIVLLAGAVSYLPVSAEQLQRIPLIGKLFSGNIFTIAGDSGIHIGQNAGLSTEVPLIDSDQGVTIKLQDALFDGARLSISYEINSAKPDNLMFIQNITVAVNGGPLKAATFETKPRQINANQSIGILTVDMDQMEWIEKFILELNINQIRAADLGETSKIAGKWSFKLPIENHALENSKYKKLVKGPSAKSEDGEFQLTDYLITPITTKLGYRFEGNTEWLRFQVKDGQGMIIDWLNSRSDTTANGVIGTSRYVPLPEGTKEIFVTPYYLLPDIVDEELKKVKVNLTDNYPITLSQGNVGEIRVNNVEFQSEKTLIYYEVIGKNPHIQSASLWMETSDGQMVISGPGNRKRISDSTYSYVLEYPALNPNESYVLGTMIQTDLKLLEELTLKLIVE